MRKLYRECAEGMHERFWHQQAGAMEYGYCVGQYSGSLRRALLLWKHRGAAGMTAHFAELTAAALPIRLYGIPITYIPCHPRSRKKRGWDPVQQLSTQLAAVTGSSCMSVFRRSGWSSVQKKLDKQKRRQNAAHMLSCRLFTVPAEIVVIDDVRTTGASLDAARGLLHEAGCSKVHCIAIAQDPLT